MTSTFPCTVMLLRLATGIVCLLSCLPCQGRGGERGSGEEATRVEEMVRERAKQQEGREKGEKGEKSESGDAEKPDGSEKLTPEEKLARNITNGASAHCRFVATMKPAKLMPGQTGTMLVTALLQGHAVIPAPPPLMESHTVPQQGPVTVGGLTMRAAEPGRLEPGYLGRPVYENFAVFEVPVTMAPDAEMGKKHVVAVDMKFDLYDGNSAQVIGRFTDRVTTEVEVGKVPDPAVQRGSAASAERGTQTQPVSTPAVPAVPTDDGSKVTPPVRGADPVPVAPAPGASETQQSTRPAKPADLPVPDTEDGIPLPILIGGGVVALCLVLLLARKK